jgi:predicted transcriptional regulator of viral defense system
MARPLTMVDLDRLGLASAFSTATAAKAGLTRSLLDRLVRDGNLERLGRGVFLRSEYADTVDTDLVEIAVRVPAATICLASALARHGLSDEIPAAVDLALPRNRWPPVVATRVAWHRFAEDTFAVGRQALDVADTLTIGLYSAERSIIDAFRTRGATGFDLATEALRRWLRTPAHRPAHLLSLCRHWPRTQTSLRNALEILL